MITKEHRSKNLKIMAIFFLFLLISPFNVKGEDNIYLYDKFKLKDGDVAGYILKKEVDIGLNSVVSNPFKPTQPEIDKFLPKDLLQIGILQVWGKNKGNNTKTTSKVSNPLGISYYLYKTPSQALLAMKSKLNNIASPAEPTDFLIGDISLDYSYGIVFIRKNVFIMIMTSNTEQYKILDSIDNTIVSRIDNNFTMSPTIDEVINDIHLLKYMELIEKDSVQDLEDKLLSAKGQEKEKSIETLKSFITELESHTIKKNRLGIKRGVGEELTKEELESAKDKYLTTPVANALIMEVQSVINGLKKK